MTIKELNLISDKRFIKSMKTHTNLRQALLSLGLNDNCNNYRLVKNRCKKLHLKIPRKIFNKQEPLSPLTPREIRNSISNEIMILACSQANSRRQLLKLLKLGFSGYNVKWVSDKIKNLSIDTKHWLGKAHWLGTNRVGFKKTKRQYTLGEILTNNSPCRHTRHIKKRLLAENVLEYKCIECGISSWRDKKLVLQLHHINGNRADNRLENLCLLCPNCHTQTDNWGSKKRK